MAWWILRGRSDWLFADVLQVMKQRLEGRCFFWSICSCGSSGCRFFLAPSKGRADTAVAPFHFQVTERLLRPLLPPVCVEKGRAGGSSLCSQRPDFAGTSLLALLRAAVGVASERRMELSRSAFTRVVPLPPEQKKSGPEAAFFPAGGCRCCSLPIRYRTSWFRHQPAPVLPRLPPSARRASARLLRRWSVRWRQVMQTAGRSRESPVPLLPVRQ